MIGFYLPLQDVAIASNLLYISFFIRGYLTKSNILTLTGYVACLVMALLFASVVAKIENTDLIGDCRV